MPKILRNTTASPILITDTGVNVPASPTTYTIPAQDYALWSASSDIVTYIGSGDIVVNDGSFDLSKADGISLLQGNFKQNDFVPALKSGTTGNERLKVDMVFSAGFTTDNIAEGSSNLYFTNERAQDAVGAALTDTASVDLVYDDAGNSISAVVLPAGVNHNQLQNYVANQHIDHTTVSISAGTGLTGGGDLTADRTISIANTGVTAATYGTGTAIPQLGINAQGQITTAGAINVAMPYADHYNGTTRYNNQQLRAFSGTGTTDANGRITFNLTTTGISGGTALFTSILTANAIGLDASGSPIQAPQFFIESISATQVVFRAVRGTSTGVLIGGTVVSAQYVGAGYTAWVQIIGVKN